MLINILVLSLIVKYKNFSLLKLALKALYIYKIGTGIRNRQ